MPKPRWPAWGRYYILIGKLAVPCKNAMEWADWFEKSYSDGSRIVAQTVIGGVRVSTVFLSLDHNYVDNGDPHLFETMVFRGGVSDDTYRCSTWEQAEKQHAEIVAKIRAEIKAKVNQ